MKKSIDEDEILGMSEAEYVKYNKKRWRILYLRIAFLIFQILVLILEIIILAILIYR